MSTESFTCNSHHEIAHREIIATLFAVFCFCSNKTETTTKCSKLQDFGFWKIVVFLIDMSAHSQFLNVTNRCFPFRFFIHQNVVNHRVHNFVSLRHESSFWTLSAMLMTVGPSSLDLIYGQSSNINTGQQNIFT